MRKILSHRDEMLLQLINQIAEREFDSFAELQAIINIHPKTLNSLIDYGNEVFYPIRIARSSAGKISLYIPKDLSIKYCYQMILKNSIEFQIIEHIFFNVLTLKELSDNLYISDSTLRRKIRHINKELIKIGVTIDTTTMDFDGDEKQICHLIIYLLSEKYIDCMFLFNRHQERFIEKSILRIMRLRRMKISYPDLYRVKLWTLVVLYRAKSKSSPSNHIKTTYSRSILERLFPVDLLRRNIGLLSMENPYIIFIEFFFFNRLSLSYKELERKCTRDQLLNQNKERFESILDLIEKEFLISADGCREQIILDLCNVSMTQINNPFILYDKYSQFVSEVSKANSQFTTRLKILFYSYFPEAEDYTINSFIYILYTHWNNLFSLLRQQAKKVSISLVFDSDTEHMYFIKNLIETVFRDLFTIKVIDNFKSLSELKNCISTSFIVTNIDNLDLPNQDIIHFSMYPTNSELENLYSVYENPKE